MPRPPTQSGRDEAQPPQPATSGLGACCPPPSEEPPNEPVYPALAAGPCHHCVRVHSAHCQSSRTFPSSCLISSSRQVPPASIYSSSHAFLHNQIVGDGADSTTAATAAAGRLRFARTDPRGVATLGLRRNFGRAGGGGGEIGEESSAGTAGTERPLTDGERLLLGKAGLDRFGFW